MSSLTRSIPLAGALVVPLVVMAAPASHATEGARGSAYGVVADGLVTLPATPSVQSTSTRPIRESVVDLPKNPLVNASALVTSARAGYGRASVADLKLTKALLNAELVTARCQARKGSAHLGKAFLQGRRLAVTPKPNSALQVPIEGVGTASVVLNSQRRTPAGDLTVTAVEVNLPPVAGKPQRVGIASVTCGAKATPAKPKTPPQQQKPQIPAPAPKPVPRDLPVTG
ncbi:choice-of-anchor P family protein [Thermomonospora echinospora]|nr:choice-of-anchor P family protein [Thermomonospora echinospora]